jgi:hypothetical protein
MAEASTMTEGCDEKCEEHRQKMIAALDCIGKHLRVNQILAGYRVYRETEVGESRCEGCVLEQYCKGIRRGLQSAIGF